MLCARLLRITGITLTTAVLPLAYVHAETVNCTAITTLPYIISTQGVYCLTGHLSTGITTGNAITINTNNVVLDVNGFKLGGLSAGLGTQAIGIFANQRQNITIKNGTVRGFYIGIWLSDSLAVPVSQGHVIEDIRADQNTWMGMEISGMGNIIRNNQVVTTGGTTVPSASTNIYGIQIFGPAARVLNNDVTDVFAQGTGNAHGISLVASGSNSVVAGNRVIDITAPGGNAYGIETAGNDVVVSDNRLSGVQYGIYMSGGTTGGVYMNNLVRGATTPYTGGTPAGTTNY